MQTRTTRIGEKFTREPQFHKHDFDYDFLVSLVEQKLRDLHVVDKRNDRVDNEQCDEAPIPDNNAVHWELVYKQHSNKKFPIKNYICKCFPELDVSDEELTVMECGSGTGSCVLPLVVRHEQWKFVACDFSCHAIETLKSHSIYQQNQQRIDAFVWDISDSKSDVLTRYSAAIDKILLVFVLSAMASVEQMKEALTNIHRLLKVNGGILLFRDYGQYDMAHTRFLMKMAKSGKSVETSRNSVFQRDDGTFSFFYTIDFCTQLFTECGFKVLDLEYHTVKLRNNKTDLDMYRVFINGRFERA